MAALPSQTGGVDEDEGAVAAGEDGVDRVPGGAGRLRDDHAVLPDECVDGARLADVRPSEDGDADRVFGDLRAGGTAGQPFEDRVQEVARAVPVHRRDRHRLAQSQAVELVDHLVCAARIVDLVRDHGTGRPEAAEQIGHFLVARRDAGLGVDDEEDEIGFLDRGASLFRDLA